MSPFLSSMIFLFLSIYSRLFVFTSLFCLTHLVYTPSLVLSTFLFWLCSSHPLFTCSLDLSLSLSLSLSLVCSDPMESLSLFWLFCLGAYLTLHVNACPTSFFLTPVSPPPCISLPISPSLFFSSLSPSHPLSPLSLSLSLYIYISHSLCPIYIFSLNLCYFSCFLSLRLYECSYLSISVNVSVFMPPDTSIWTQRYLFLRFS